MCSSDLIALRTDVFTTLNVQESGWFGHWLSEGQVNTGGSIGGTQDSNDYIRYDFTTGALYYDADGSGAGAPVQFAQLTSGLYLSDANFVVYTAAQGDDFLIGQFLT